MLVGGWVKSKESTSGVASLFQLATGICMLRSYQPISFFNNDRIWIVSIIKRFEQRRNKSIYLVFVLTYKSVLAQLQEGTTSLQFANWAAMKPVKTKRSIFLEDGMQR